MLVGLGFLSVASGLKAQGTPATPPASPSRFPNVTLRTHEGRSVRFYDDLLKGKIVLINFMYAQCTGICPGMTANLGRVQAALGDRVGRDVFLYSFTLQPQHDTPEVLAEYARAHHVGPGWLFITGAPPDMEMLRRRLGFFDSDPLLDADKSEHIGLVRIGNEPLDRWLAEPALSKPELIVESVHWVEGAPSRLAG
jgi:protein SCO1/2